MLYQCTQQYVAWFRGSVYAYKGILLLFGLFLAWETRNVTIAALNDSKYIGMCVYNVVILSVIGVIISVVLHGTVHYEITYTIASVIVLACTTVTLSLVFIPKVSLAHVQCLLNSELAGERPPRGSEPIHMRQIGVGL